MKEKKLQKVVAIDQKLRKLIAEYYMELEALNDPDVSVKLLAEHVTIMVEMMKGLKDDE